MGVAVQRCDMVLLGAEGVVESGGVLTAVGAFPLGIVAKSMGKPLYVAAESYKFARMFPLDQNDWEQALSEVPANGGLTSEDDSDAGVNAASPTVPMPAATAAAPGAPSAAVALPPVGPRREYTPPDLLTLLFTDLGVLTPAAVSDELIQLYL
eukprot:TRINITY_DN18354_c0_g1_i1.p1 TRINITY_DN18354_c0_g1~~TRINITY_DN18354_c0_g1_i1.p1  ORF type:complete len:171 (+),score=12.97 TRINITY_DN18354_c0_g1_i1:57-515(+)